jgi:hypothetical protein
MLWPVSFQVARAPMFQIIGIVMLFACVFGSYVLAGGKFA